VEGRQVFATRTDTSTARTRFHRTRKRSRSGARVRLNTRRLDQRSFKMKLRWLTTRLIDKVERLVRLSPLRAPQRSARSSTPGALASSKVLADLRDAQMKQSVVAGVGEEPDADEPDLTRLQGSRSRSAGRITSRQRHDDQRPSKRQGSLSQKAEQALANWTQGQQFTPEIVN
jgi:hypothetical protein